MAIPPKKKNITLYVSKTWQEHGRKFVEGIASDESVDRVGDVILSTAWELDNFKKNPVLLWAHQYDKPPVGKVIDVWVEDGKLRFRAVFADTEFAHEVARLYDEGFLNGFSVGFLPLEYEPNKETGGYIYKRIELLEISAGPVPINPNAVTIARAKGKGALTDNTLLEKGGERMETIVKAVIPYKKTPLAPQDQPWDAAKEVKRASVEDLKIMCTWYDEEKPDVKQSYKLPHHMATENYSCVWRGVATAMAVLFGAMGGVNIPEKDKKGVYDHLAKHYRDFDKEPPEWGKTWDEVKDQFKFLTDEEIKKMITLWKEVDEKMNDEVKPGEIEEKAGAVLSKRNAEKLMNLAGKVQDAIKVLDEAVQELTDFVKAATGNTASEEEKLYTEEEVMKILNTYREKLLEKLGGEKDD